MLTFGSTNIGGGSSSKGFPIGNVINLKAKAKDGKIELTWQDPDDIKVDDQTVVAWKGTKVVYKTTDYPVNENDGVLALNSTTRNQYQKNAFIISDLTNGQVYYIQLFPYTVKNYVTISSVNRVRIAPQAYRTMTVIIDQTNSDPDTCISYADNAVGMIAKSTDWDDFFGCRPCLFKNGKVVGYLNPDNFAQFEDGSTADITSGDAGDVMIEIPRMGLNITNDNDNTITVSITNDPNNSEFSYLAHSRGSTLKDNLYIGAYLGYNQNNKIRSLSGKIPTAGISYTNYLSYCQANGAPSGSGTSGYDMLGFYPITLLQAMYLLKYKSLNSQTALGTGYVEGSGATTTGGTNTKGMCFGSNSQTEQMKLFGIEDFYGNLVQWVGGLYCSSSSHILTATENYNITGSGYTDNGLHDSGLSSEYKGYITKIMGTTETGFYPKVTSGSNTTYYCDWGYSAFSNVAYFGGDWSSGANCGAFYLYVNNSASSSYSNLGSRLMFL